MSGPTGRIPLSDAFGKEKSQAPMRALLTEKWPRLLLTLLLAAGLLLPLLGMLGAAVPVLPCLLLLLAEALALEAVTGLVGSLTGLVSTLLGWKENLNMSFRNDVPAQCAALSYAARAIKMYPDIKGIYMGGHSKGGNLAAYAAVCLPAKYRPIVKGVFSYDGPGFSNSFIAEHAIDEMADRMYTFLPEGSTVGRVLEHAESYEVVKSTVSKLLQHDLYTWSVKPLRLERAEKPSDGSEIFYNSVRHLVEETTPRQREMVLDGVYTIVTANASRPRDIQQDFSILLQPLYQKLRTMNREDWQVVTTVFRAFLDAYVLALRDVGRSKYDAEIQELRSAENFQEATMKLLRRGIAAWNRRTNS